MNNSDDETIEIFQRINRLKAKVGGNPNDTREGALEKGVIKKADELIKDFCKDCDTIVFSVLEKLMGTWKKVAEMKRSSKRDDLAQEMFTLAHEVKDVAGMCGYKLMSEFAESLRDYITETSLDQDTQKIIVQAHIDAMNAALRNNIRDEGGPAAMELKALVKRAIEKYS